MTPTEKASTPTDQASFSTEITASSSKTKQREFIYRPQDEGDKPYTEQGGIKFQANVPVMVPDSVCILQLHREERETPDGIRSRAVERKVPLHLALAGNPWFEIDGIKPPRVRPHARLPETADEYRGFAIHWITQSYSAVSMQQRWDAEAKLRERCGVAGSDLQYIMPVFDNRKQECAQIERMHGAVA